MRERAHRGRSFRLPWSWAAAVVLSICITSVMQAQQPPLTVSCLSSTQTSLQVRVCAGGATQSLPFIVQWVTQADFDSSGFTNACSMSVANAPTGTDCITVDLADATCKTAFVCGTSYVISVAYQDSKDVNMTTCSTQPCTTGGGCTLTQGYWKNHPQAWPVSSLTLGSVTYTEAQLIAILQQPVQGNGLVSLAHQLIAAELNIAAGASAPSSVTTAIAQANALIGSLIIPPIGSGYLSPASTSALTDILDQFNSGTIGPGHCD